MTEIATDEGKLYLATVLDLFSRKLLASPTAEHPDAELAGDAIKMAAAVRGGRTVIDGVIFHTDRIDLYGKRFHETVPPARRCAVDGQGRVVFRQRRLGGVLLHPRT
jgi:transposase InsO family protein